ncbi:hypothetical protein ACHAWF_005896, partial [Thalassiosira exigua]
MKFYSSTQGSNWLNNTGWDTEVNECTWFGVECDSNGKISGICLPRNGLTGRGLVYLTYLPSLKHMDLSQNDLVTPLPPFHQMEFLEEVDLSHNMFTGYLHRWSSRRFPQLKYLNLSSNALQGSIPVEIGINMHSLESLDLSHNQFTFEFQESFYRDLHNLTTLRLSHNNLVGELPSYEGVYYPKLSELNVSHNRMRGELPKDLFHNNTAKTINLDISQNHFGFVFPYLAIQRLNVNASGNRFQRLDENVCSQAKWNDGDLQTFRCDGLMCPPETFNPVGRQVSIDSPCVECKYA